MNAFFVVYFCLQTLYADYFRVRRASRGLLAMRHLLGLDQAMSCLSNQVRKQRDSNPQSTVVILTKCKQAESVSHKRGALLSLCPLFTFSLPLHPLSPSQDFCFLLPIKLIPLAVHLQTQALVSTHPFTWPDEMLC